MRVAASSALARRNAPWRSCCRRCSAMRCAAFGPTPGRQRSAWVSSSRLPSGSTSLVVGYALFRAAAASDQATLTLERQLEACRQRKSCAQAAHLLLGGGLDFAHCVVDGRRDQVFEHVLVLG